MIFSTDYWPIALLWAFIGALMAGGLAFLGGSREGSRGKTVTGGSVATAAAMVNFFVSLLLVRIVMYYIQPSFQGSFGGYWPLLFVTVVPAAVIGSLFSGAKRTIGYSVLAVVVLFVVPIVQYGANAWGPENARKHADLPKITTAGPDELIPPTDPDRMVKVTLNIAVFKGQTALSTESGIASRYGINENTYTLQYVNGHRYWLAPLHPLNSGDTFWTPLFGGRATSPGYVVVDAENPNKDAWLVTHFKGKDGKDVPIEISLFVDQPWSMNLERFIYQAGYNHGLLEEPIFEVNDNWEPFYTLSYVKRAFGGMTGRSLEKVIVVNVSKSDPTVEDFDLDKKPEWVDRVVADDLVKEWATDWGMYGGEYARKNFWSVAFGFNKTGTMEPADQELNYTKDHHNVWVVPMTSTNEKDHTVLGVLVFETGKNDGKFYPGIKGFNEPKSVEETMVNARDNIKHYPVEKVQLFNIYGELTWVAIYAAPQSIGKSFGGIGMLHAHSQDAADVIYATDMPTALRQYATQLARRGQGNGSISQTANQSKEITARIKRIAELPSTSLGATPTYQFVIEGDDHTFVVSKDAYLRIALVEKGDEVTFTYLETNSPETAVNTFKCKGLDSAAAPAPAPAVEKK